MSPDASARPTETGVDYSRKWYVLAAVGTGVFLATVDASIVNIALPTLVRSFETRFSVVQWVPLAYMLTVATLLLSLGRLGDLTGKRKIYASGMMVFTVGSALCGFSQTIYWLIGARVFQAVGASMIAALSTAIVTEAFPARQRGKAVGSIGGIVSIGIITGPVLGGILIDTLSWHWIFFVNIPIGLIGAAMVLRVVPDLKAARGQKFDFKGCVILFVSVLTFLLALTLGQELGFRSLTIALLFGGWMASFVLFLHTEARVPDPMVDLRLFQNSVFSLGLMIGFLSFFSTAGVVLLMPFYLENVLGYDPHQVGLLLAVVPLSAGLTSPVAGTLSDRLGTRTISSLGLALLVVGYYSLTTLSLETTAPGYVLRFAPVGLGLGIFQSANNSAIIGAAPKQHLGVASGLLSLTRTLGQTSGIASLGAFWAARVSIYSGGVWKLGPTLTSAEAQVNGLHDTLTGIVILMCLAFLLSIWSLVQLWTHSRT